MNRFATLMYMSMMIIWITFNWQVWIPGIIIGIYIGAWQGARLRIWWVKLLAFLELRLNDQADKRKKQ